MRLTLSVSMDIVYLLCKELRKWQNGFTKTWNKLVAAVSKWWFKTWKSLGLLLSEWVSARWSLLLLFSFYSDGLSNLSFIFHYSLYLLLVHLLLYGVSYKCKKYPRIVQNGKLQSLVVLLLLLLLSSMLYLFAVNGQIFLLELKFQQQLEIFSATQLVLSSSQSFSTFSCSQSLLGGH